MKNFKLFKRSEKDPNRVNVWPMLLAILFFLVFGVLLVWLRSTALTIAAYVLAGLMLLLGGYQIFIYIRSAPIRRITESRLASGLILILSGVLLAFNTKVLLDQLFPVLWGLSLLFGCFLKIQYAFDEYTVKIKKWWIMLIFAAFSLIVGILSLLQPEFLGESKELVIGIFLICEAVLDGTVVFLLTRALKKADPSLALPSPAAPAAAAADGPDIVAPSEDAPYGAVVLPDPVEKAELPQVPIMSDEFKD